MLSSEIRFCIAECEDPRLKQVIKLPFDDENEVHFLVPKGQKKIILDFLKDFDFKKVKHLCMKN